ncbi:hypothetical protein [Cupriavidus pauculus]|uniref:Uncharacterized protein n=1 Tax=Cupriavidus pauculus TaxID=82633 RepID=A0A3G8H344_9BURK|nr:hypothetical protein [Cupriavidus pauculus]AZG14824.1 hypothetical protein EHF44_16120 [Cupriavidus pauculus]
MKKLLGFAMAAILAAHGDVVVAESGQIADAQHGAACVSVEVNGQRAPALDCLNERLARGVQAQRPPEAATPGEQAAGRPSNQLGLFNYSATANRMGNTFGTSAQAQRPPERVTFMPAVGPRR